MTRNQLFCVIIAIVAIALVCFSSATSFAAPQGVDITVTTGGSSVVIVAPGCMNFDGSVRNFDITVRSGAWVSNGFDPIDGWITLVSNGSGRYALNEWRALHICGGVTTDEAFAELGKVDPGGVINPRRVINPIPSATATATSYSPTATPVPSTHVLIVVMTAGGAATLTDPGCLNYDGLVQDFTIAAFSGTWVSNGFFQPTEGSGYWVNLYGQERAVYRLSSWGGYHVCAGRSLEEAVSELAGIDPGAAGNPVQPVPFERLIFRLDLPFVQK
jgi:hypothetical protein